MNALTRSVLDAADAKRLEYEHRTPNPHNCAVELCAMGSAMISCTRCKRRYYCSVQHRQLDWFVHRRFCRILEMPIVRSPLVSQWQLRLDNPKRIGVAECLANNFMKDLTGNTYPAKDEEAVWGIRFQSRLPPMDYVGIAFPIGPLMFRAWTRIIYLTKHKGKSLKAFEQDLVSALLAGRLVDHFQRIVARTEGLCVFCAELVLREFRGIPWDAETHVALALSSSEDCEFTDEM